MLRVTSNTPYVDLFEAVSPFVTNGYLQVFLEGGLNQQRMGVSTCLAYKRA